MKNQQRGIDVQENEKFEKEDAKLAEEMQAWLPEEKYILLERRILITFLRVNARINAVEKPSIWIRGLECVGIALSAGVIGAAVVVAITKI